MFIPAKIVLEHYIPQELKPGMYFVKHEFSSVTGNDTVIEQVWQLEDTPKDYQDFIEEYNFPVNLSIFIQMSDNPDQPMVKVAEEHEIGWIDVQDELLPLSTPDINHILKAYQGHVGIYMDDEEEDQAHLEDGKVVLCIIDELYEDYDDDEEEIIN